MKKIDLTEIRKTHTYHIFQNLPVENYEEIEVDLDPEEELKFVPQDER